MAIMTTHFARVMNKALERKGLTKYRLAKLSGVAEGLLSRYGSGKQTPEDDTVIKIAKALTEAPEEFLKAVWQDRHGDKSTEFMDALTRATSRPGVTMINQNLGITSSDQGNQASITFRRTAGVRLLPRYGPAAAGEAPMFSESDAPEMVAVSEGWATGADAIFQVSGNCLSAKGIRDGDELLVARLDGQRPHSGATVVVEVEGVYVVKIYRRDSLGEYLESHEEGGEPERMVYPAGSRVVGRAVRMMRDL